MLGIELACEFYSVLIHKQVSENDNKIKWKNSLQLMDVWVPEGTYTHINRDNPHYLISFTLMKLF